MKALSVAFLLLSTLVLVSTGCTDTAEQTSGPAIHDGVSGLTLAKGNTHTASGTGHWESTPWGNLHIRVTFSAAKHANGSVSGHLQVNDLSGACKLHANISDLQVDPVHSNRAKLIGTIDWGQYVGSTAFVVVVDDGEGPNAVDQISYIPFLLPEEAIFYYGLTLQQIAALGIDEFLDRSAQIFLELPPGHGEEFLRGVVHGSVHLD